MGSEPACERRRYLPHTPNIASAFPSAHGVRHARWKGAGGAWGAARFYWHVMSASGQAGGMHSLQEPCFLQREFALHSPRAEASCGTRPRTSCPFYPCSFPIVTSCTKGKQGHWPLSVLPCSSVTRLGHLWRMSHGKVNAFGQCFHCSAKKQWLP